MKLTKSQLRSIIREVINESKFNSSIWDDKTMKLSNIIKESDIISDKEILAAVKKDIKEEDRKPVNEELITVSTILLGLGTMALLAKIVDKIKVYSMKPSERDAYNQSLTKLKEKIALIKKLEKENNKEEADKQEKEYEDLLKDFETRFTSKLGRFLSKAGNIGITAIDKMLSGIHKVRTMLKKDSPDWLSNPRKRNLVATVIFVVIATLIGYSDPSMFTSWKTILPFDTLKNVVSSATTVDALGDAILAGLKVINIT